MAKYTVTIPYHTTITVEVEAANAREAMDNAYAEAEDKKYQQEALDNMQVDGDLEVTNEETGMGDYIDRKDPDEDTLAEIDSDLQCFSTGDAVRAAFPKMSKKAVDIITGWYEAEEAIDDFDKKEDFANFIREDILDMLDAADNQDEIDIVVVALKKEGFQPYVLEK